MMLSTRMWQVAVATHSALIVAVALRDFSALSLFLAVVLLPPLPGIIRKKSYTCAWASMLVAFYVAGYLAAGYSQPHDRFGPFLMASLAAADYVSLMLFVRFRARETAALAHAAPAERSEGSDDAAP